MLFRLSFRWSERARLPGHPPLPAIPFLLNVFTVVYVLYILYMYDVCISSRRLLGSAGLDEVRT